MFGLNWLKIAIYGGSALLMIGMLWTINGWRKDSKQLSSITLQLESELSCREGSKCAARIIQEAEEGAKAVKEAKDKAHEENEREKAERDKAAQAEAEKNSKAIAARYEKLLEITKKHSVSCDVWQAQINPCPMD